MPTRMKAATTQARRATADVTRQLAELRDMTVGQLRDKYREVFGEPTRSRNKRSAAGPRSGARGHRQEPSKFHLL